MEENSSDSTSSNRCSGVCKRTHSVSNRTPRAPQSGQASKSGPAPGKGMAGKVPGGSGRGAGGR
eukprot:742725-Rhodomonas_salina.1